MCAPCAVPIYHVSDVPITRLQEKSASLPLDRFHALRSLYFWYRQGFDAIILCCRKEDGEEISLPRAQLVCVYVCVHEGVLHPPFPSLRLSPRLRAPRCTDSAWTYSRVQIVDNSHLRFVVICPSRAYRKRESVYMYVRRLITKQGICNFTSRQAQLREAYSLSCPCL